MEGLVAQPVRPFSAAARDVRSLYLSAFPPNERQPYPLLQLFSWQKSVAFTAYYDQATFVGFSYVIETSQVTFTFLLAVSQTQRSKGYGQRILEAIAHSGQGKIQVLCIEPMDEEADNYEQRLKRLAFYQANGYRRQHRYFHELAETYEVLATSNQVDYQRLAKDLNRISLGLLKIKID